METECTGDDSIVVTDKNIGQNLTINWDGSYSQKVLHFFERLVSLELQIEMFFNNYDFAIDNPNMVFIKNSGFYKDGYAEFLFEYHCLECEFSLWNFNIENIKVSIGEPSSLFKLLLSNISSDDQFIGWESLYTISIHGISVTKENYENYLHQALYLINHNNPSLYLNDHPQIYQFQEEHEFYSEEELPEIETIDFQEAKYCDVLSFFNEAEKSINEISFLYYYKVLEYFFIINRKDQIADLVSSYGNNIDKLISKLTSFYRTAETECLRYLLNNLKKEAVQNVISSAFNEELIATENLDELIKELYIFRNSVVHGKKDSGYQTNIPTIFINQRTLLWRKLTRELALLCINKFCWQNND